MSLPPALENLFTQTPQIQTLDNGLTLIHQPSRAHPLVSVQAWIRTGSIHEEQHLGSGLSHFLEHMLFKGTGKRASGEIASEVQAFGGQINAYTSFDRTVYYIDGPSEELGHCLELLADMTLNASLPRSEVDKERDVVLREIDMTLDDPDRRVARGLFSTAFQRHPFQYPVIGLRPLFKEVGRDVLADYYNRRYHPANLILAVAGKFEPEELVTEVERHFSGFSRRPLHPVSIPEEMEQLARRESRLYGDYQTTRGMVAFKIPSLRHPDSPALDILAAIMGSGHSGKLRQRLREEQELVHGISASAWNPGHPGLFFIQYVCAPGNSAAAEEAILETCHELAETGFTREELDKARQFALISEGQTRKTCSGLASRLGLVSAVVGDINYPRRYFEKLYDLTPEDLREAAGRTFRDDRVTLSTLMPESCRPKTRLSSAESELPPFQQKVLPNGARLLWQRDSRIPRTWIRFAGLGGCQYEADSERGATSLLVTLLNRDTEFHDAAEAALLLESSGGFMMETSGNNTFAFNIETMPDRIGEGIEALHDALFHPAFLEQTFKREQAAQVANIKELQDEILDHGRIALRQHFFGTHPFSSHPFGSIETTAGLDVAVLKNLWSRLLSGPNAVLVIAGDFQPQDILPRLETLLLKVPASGFTPQAIPFTGPAETGQVIQHMDREQAIVLEAYPDVGVRPEADLVGEVLDELLSDMSGPLFRSVREDESLAYFVGAARLLGLEFGCFYLYAGTHPDSVQAVYNCFELELQRIRDGNVTREELQSTVTRLKVQNRFSLQNPSTRAARVALNVLYGKPAMDWLDYESRLDSLTPEHLTNFANTFLVPGKRLRLTITPN